MKDKKQVQDPEPQKTHSMRELQDLTEHVLNVLVDNGKTHTLVYGLLLSLIEESKRGITRKTLKKEIHDAIDIAHEQFGYLFYDDEPAEGGDE